MPREQLQLLAADVDRLLAAGAAVAAGDEGLRRRGKALRDLGQKAPVLLQIADAVDRAVNAPPKQVTPALLDLLLIVRQVRASLAAAGAAGGPAPVEAGGPWASAAPLREVEHWVDTLTGSGYHRTKVLKKALARPDFTDIRLIGPLLRSLGSTHHQLARLAARKALPLFGKTVVPELERAFTLKGKAVDARRLEAICVLDPKKGAALCRQALADGSTPVKIQGLESLSEIAPEETEPAALGLLKEKGAEDVHSAAYRALATGKTDEALEALLRGLLPPTKYAYWDASQVSLRRFKHPKVTARLLEELTKLLPRIQELSPKKGKKAQAPAKGKAPSKAALAKAEQKQARELEETVNATDRILSVLGERGDTSAVPRVVELLQHANLDVRHYAGNALLNLGDRAGLEALADLVDDSKLWSHGISAAWLLPDPDRFERLQSALATLSLAKPAQRSRGDTLLGEFWSQLPFLGEWDEGDEFDEDELDDMDDEEEEEGEDWDDEDDEAEKQITDWDPRWVPALRKHLNGPSRNGVVVALTVIEREKFIPDLLRLLVPSATKGEIGVLQVLARLRVKEAVKPLIDLLPVKTAHTYWVADTLRRLGDRSHVPQLEETCKKIKDTWRRQWVERLIEQLEKNTPATDA